ncbi:hypothetical protein [uncultured Polaribacter sp.]|uniref:hypothetical protein n=1 Tax=uncultured Polaribacter sp. TaxID=174711 RepID=UPI00261461C8|nr:hypothetical protein [uncultured Polaribacter sp.]
MKTIQLSLFIITLLFVSCQTKKRNESKKIVLNAITDFNPVKREGIAPFYKHKKKNALAINAVIYKNLFSAANTVFKGKSGLYDIDLTTLKETDGESFYKIFVNDSLLKVFQNSATEIDYEPSIFTVKNVKLKKDAVLEVQFNSHSNLKIPENDSFAFSRGRWTSLTLIPIE